MWSRERSTRAAPRLDLRPVERARFAGLMARIEEAGYDPGEEPILVAPAAHYTMGGVLTDLDGRTEVAGLYAAGEVACTGCTGQPPRVQLAARVFARPPAALAALGENEPVSRSRRRRRRRRTRSPAELRRLLAGRWGSCATAPGSNACAAVTT